MQLHLCQIHRSSSLSKIQRDTPSIDVSDVQYNTDDTRYSVPLENASIISSQRLKLPT